MNHAERMKWLRTKFSEIATRQAEIELEIGVVPLEYAQEQRRIARRKLAALEALFGPRGTYEERRKSYRSEIATEIETAIVADIDAARAEAMRESDDKLRKAKLDLIRKYPSDTELERLAAGDPRVVRWLRTAAKLRRQWEEAKDAPREWEEHINRGQAICRYVGGTPSAAGETSAEEALFPGEQHLDGEGSGDGA
jgi:hypothetical protein